MLQVRVSRAKISTMETQNTRVRLNPKGVVMDILTPGKHQSYNKKLLVGIIRSETYNYI